MLLPNRPDPKGGRPFVDDRVTSTRIEFGLKFGIPWMALRFGMGGGEKC